tara:strand:- start:37 stop:360 length:324 start_codon:yes stop_codon:yes gene_type:complete
MITNKDAVLSLYEINHSGSGIHISGKCESDLSGVKLLDKSTLSFTFDDVLAKKKELTDEYEKQAYARARQQEYPSISELVVALYDADDKAEIDKKRAEIKKKYPKPE